MNESQKKVDEWFDDVMNLARKHNPILGRAMQAVRNDDLFGTAQALGEAVGEPKPKVGSKVLFQVGDEILEGQVRAIRGNTFKIVDAGLTKIYTVDSNNVIVE